MTTTTTANAVTSNTRAALLILEHAERTGLPLPLAVRAGADITFMAASVEDLTDWSNWMEQPIETTTDRDGNLHRNIDGLALDQQINVFTVELAADTAADR